MNGLTAKMCLDALALVSGNALLVTGAAGAVGGYVVQLARRAGLHVIADARPEDRELVLGLGANEVVPRGPDLFDAVRELHPRGVDGLVDGALLGDSAAALVRDGGATALLRGSQIVSDARLRHTRISVVQQTANADALRWLAERVRDGSLSPRVSARLPIERAQDAYGLVLRGGLRGRVVLTFAS
jgi:NADPH:quinone reductase-like Zn-dependent oxidoreductase